ncbi:hypothetical protein MRO55_26230, partial [Escherichia coli]|uniref:hypothetical protein n=1 Tax=Escherichia coli TaxID=562 RepID=UPI002114C465
TVVKTLSSGETHRYRVSIGAGQFIRMLAEQRDADLKITIIGTDGKQLAEVDIQSELNKTESACWLAEGEGNYQIVIATS